MNDLSIQTKQTMSLKEITDLLETRHNNAMITVAKMAEEPEFGTLLKVSSVYNGKGQTIETYQLDKRQSLAVSARLNVALLMRIIDRWQELENEPKTIIDYARALIASHEQVEKLEHEVKITNEALSYHRNETRWLEDRLEQEIENKKLYGGWGIKK